MLISRKIVFVLVGLVAALSVGVVVYIIRTQNFPSTPSFVFGGIERTYLLHVPPSYDGRTAVPLVIVLHGYGETSTVAQNFITVAKSDKEGFILVCPQGVNAQWNAGFGAFNSSIDDVGFIRELINRLEQKYAIDPRRIYVAGFSNGAMMAYRLGAELSDRIAAIAPVAGSIGGMTGTVPKCISEPTQEVSVIVFHGTSDGSVPYGGGSYISVAESVAFWVRCDGCSTNPVNETSGSLIKSVYAGGRNGTEVVLYTVVGGGHEWPVTATDTIWDFFGSHPKQ
jgi:polyhydroxybutyrate depolymerase